MLIAELTTPGHYNALTSEVAFRISSTFLHIRDSDVVRNSTTGPLVEVLQNPRTKAWEHPHAQEPSKY